MYSETFESTGAHPQPV